MNQNLVSGGILDKLSINYVMKLRKLILFQNSVFVEKYYSTNGIVKLFVTNKFINNKNNDSVYR